MEELPTEDDERPGRHSLSRSEPLIAQVKNTMCKLFIDCLQSCRRGWKIHWFMPHNFNGRLGSHRVSAKSVPRLLTDDQKRQQFSICENLLQRVNDNENLLKNITSDETWV
jgi:hypothetical protein